MDIKERQTMITDELTRLVGHEHHCSICGDEIDLFWVEGEGYKGILCRDCIRIQKMMYNSKYDVIRQYHRHRSGNTHYKD
jgi:ribosome-binding protein aMBF1 (putative translation factor)